MKHHHWVTKVKKVILERKVQHLSQARVYSQGQTCPPILQNDGGKSSDALWRAVENEHILSALWVPPQPVLWSQAQRVGNWEIKRWKFIPLLCLPVCVGGGLKVCVCMNMCTCMCVMSQCVTRSRLSPSLHPDSSVKQGLIWSVYVFENMCVYVSGLIVFLFFLLTLFTSDPPGVPGSCLMDSLAPWSWPLARALSRTPN